MSSIYSKPNGGPWEADDDEVLCDGYESYNGFRTASIGNGPTVDGINVNAPRTDTERPHHLVNAHDGHLTRSSNR